MTFYAPGNQGEDKTVSPSAQARPLPEGIAGYLLLRLLLSLLLMAVSLGLQVGPAHLLWLQSAIWRAALRGGRGRLSRLGAQVHTTVSLAALKTLLCKAPNGLGP